jgi:diguanylate cyclase (GGDEF)-like protein/PAS domain S-box-containing protein
LRDAAGAFVGVLAMAQDVTEREQAREQLRESEARFRSLIDSLPFCCWAFDRNRRYTYQNAVDVQQWGQVVGLHQDEVLQKAAGKLDIWRELSRRALNGEIIHDESDYTVTGKTQDFLTVGGAIRDGDRIYGGGGASIDITDRKVAEARLRHHAFYDGLTGLPQRHILLERLADLMQATTLGDRQKFALLHLDLVRFKVIKYSLGHDLAEELLVAVAERLTQLMPPGVMLTRTGGSDEFAVLLENLNEFDEAIQFAEFLLQQLAHPFQLRKHELFVNASIGIVFNSDDNRTHIQDANDFFQASDTAMFQARQSGTGQCAVFDPILQIQALNRLQLDSELRRAIDYQELQLYYQPIIDLATRQLTGFEALVRWQNPQRGMVSPAEFISLAEETGLILALGAWVLRQACEQLHQWNRQFPECLRLTLSVNLSTLQLLQPDLLEQIDRVSLEITRTIILLARTLNLDVTAEGIETDDQMEHLQALQCDFGQGYLFSRPLPSAAVKELLSRDRWVL